MGKQVIVPEGVAASTLPLSQVVGSGDLVCLAGQVPFDGAGRVVGTDIVTQARQVFANMQRCLEAAGCTFGDVIKVNGYLADLADAPGYNSVYREFFAPPYPVRTTVGAQLAGVLVEVEALARRA